MSSRGEIIVGLDIGTTKICAVVGEVREGKVDVVGMGTHPQRRAPQGRGGQHRDHCCRASKRPWKKPS
jgi:cell division ATPase FtsA